MVGSGVSESELEVSRVARISFIVSHVWGDLKMKLKAFI